MQVFKNLDSLPVFRNAVVTIGSFDGVHEGHRRILDRLLRLAREVDGEAVVVTFEPHPRLVLSPGDVDFKLLNTLDEKLGLLETAGVDAVAVVPFSKQFARQTAEEYAADFLLKRFKPAAVVIGYDHRFGRGREGGIEFLKEFGARHGFSVVEIPRHEVDEVAVSSTKIRRAVEAGDVAAANRLLGRPFRLTGEVVRGDQIGRSIGFPTANLSIVEKEKLLPPPGIYAARAAVDGENWFAAMLYIGDRPTVVQPGGERRIEVNLLDFDRDIYGQKLSVEVVDFVRGDKKLDGLAALKAQIETDKALIVKKLMAHSPISSPKSPSVAVVILNYNTRRHLETYLPSVVATDFPNVDIIVADNGSPDDSVAFLEKNFPAVKILKSTENLGFAGGYNHFLAGLDADYFALLNSDVEVTPDWLRPIIERMEAEPTIGIAQPKILADGRRDRFEHAGAAGGWVDFLGYPFCRGRLFEDVETDAGQHDSPQDCFWAAGAAMFVRSKIWRDLGGFDAAYFAHNEEIDLCWRAKRAGWRVVCEPRSVVYHLGGGTLDYENPRKVFLNFRNSLFTLLKNEPAAKLLWLVPARFLLDGVAAAVFVLKGKPAMLGAILRAHGSFYGQFFSMLEKRKEAARAIEANRVGPADRAGIYRGSIVWRHFVGRARRFSDLF